MSAPTNESYEIKRVQRVVAACISPLMHQLGGQVGYYLKPWEPKVMADHFNADRWRKDNQVVDFRYDHHDGRHSEYVLFSDAFYSPDSDFTEGTPQILENVNLKVDGKSKIFDNSRGGDPIHIAYEEEVDLENSVSTSLKNAFTFDTTATTETTVERGFPRRKSGAEAGTGGPRRLLQGGRQGHRGKQDGSRDGSHRVRLSPGGNQAAGGEQGSQAGADSDCKGLFILDFSINMKLYHWWKKAPGTKFRPHNVGNFKVNSIEGLLQFAQGVDTNYPLHGRLLE